MLEVCVLTFLSMFIKMSISMELYMEMNGGNSESGTLLNHGNTKFVMN